MREKAGKKPDKSPEILTEDHPKTFGLFLRMRIKDEERKQVKACNRRDYEGLRDDKGFLFS